MTIKVRSSHVWALLFLVVLSACSSRLSKGLVAHYPFTGNAKDAGPNHLNGTVQGATLCPDRFGNANAAYSFDGNDYIEVQNDTLLNFKDDFTFAAWINLKEGKRMGSRIIDKSVGSTNYGFLFDTYGPDMQGRTLRLFCGEGWKYLSRTPLELNKWYFVTGTFRQGTGSIYINGKLDMTNTSEVKEIITSTTPMRFGMDTGIRRNIDFDDSFNGALDDIRIYHRVLTAEEIQSLYQAKK